MTKAKACPRCGVSLPPDAPAGMCPKCLLAAGLVSDTDIRNRGSDEAPTTPLPHASRFVPPSPEELAKHFPQLEILELIGAGGMEAVYKARQPGLDRLVAVKILPPEVGADPSFAQRFSREAQALARLGHQHIVSVYDFGQAGGLYYFVMEYVDGANLRHLIKTGGLQPAAALAIVPQICEALQFAHDEGVVHRDIKPENILVDKRGRVKIADFGLARLLGTAAPEISLTGTNQVLGTLHYMAPEQIQGLRTVDHRADIYSLGVVFYEMLTGELPLGRFAPPSQKVELDVRLDEIVLRSLEAEPQRRYQQVSQVKTDVERISSETPSAKSAVEGVSFEHRTHSTAVGTNENADEQQRAIELAERQPGWLPFAQLALFGVGWLFVGAMWNFGWIGFAIAIIVLAALTYVALRWTLVYLPKLRDELSRQSPVRRGFGLASGFILFALAMLLTMTTVCLIWGAFTFPRPDTDFAEQQAQLLDVLKSAKFLEVNEPFNVISVGPWTYRSRWEPLILAWVAITLAVGAVGAAIDTRRYRNSWHNSWIPTLSISAMLYAALIFLFMVFLPKGTRSVAPREVRCEASTNELKDVVKAWGRKNGYVVAERMTGIKGPAGSRALPPVPVPELKPEDLGPGPFGKGEVAVSKDGKNYLVKDGKVYRPAAEDFREAVEVVRYDLASPTPFESYRTSWQGVYRPHPPLTVSFATKTVVGSERIDNERGAETTRKNAFVRIAPAWEWLKTPESELWPPLLDDLETTLAAAGKGEHAKGDREAAK